MRSTKSAIRYAKAILDLSTESNSVNAIADNMALIVKANEETKEFQIFLNSPVIKTDKKIQILNVLFSEFTELTMSFVELITKNKRENLLVEIAAAFISLLKKQNGIVPVTVTSAVKLEKETLKTLLDSIQKYVDGDFEVTEEVDPSLIGGFVVRMDDKQIDASISSQLNRMKLELAN
jgi:F-type H+-transporting ATPase subunit delta